jgi:catechol 2,3-dioxygenase-like lactoylglutathione lyase family enzyme
MADRPTVALMVHDLARSLDFYTRIVGFALREQDDTADRAIILDVDGDAWLLAGPNMSDLADALAPNSSVLNHHDERLNFEWEGDLGAYRDEILMRGAPSASITGPVTTRWGASILTVRDPDDYQLVFNGSAHLTPEEIVSLYVQGPDDLADALADLSESDFDLAPTAGGWSIRQIVHHVADGDDLWRAPIKVALIAPYAVYYQGWYRGNEVIAERLEYAHRPIEPALALLRAGRAYVADVLRSLPTAWQQVAQMRWEEAGEPRNVPVKMIIKAQMAHVFEHADEIRAIRREHGK